MASFRKRGTKWQVQVRREGHPPISRTFIKKADAEAWARQIEAGIERSDLPIDTTMLRTTTLADLLIRYRDTVTVEKRGKRDETYRINKMLGHAICGLPLVKLTPASMARYRDARLEEVQPETVRRELTILRHALEVARREWGIPLTGNAVAEVKKPAPAHARNRRLNSDELERLLAACRRSKLLAPIVQFAVETGMRRGEIIAMRWRDADLDRRILNIPHTKNGHARTIPLSSAAIGILNSIQRNDERVFPISANALNLAWQRLRKRAGTSDLRFHDLRHEAVSSFFERGLSVPEVALISGHRDARMLFRYTHLKPEEVAKKLA
ncbi:integrase [Azospirillum tabaci]|uniref:integrase n=1 Tax=Azospirillum tabaci TaxID=2752310 RepID=UPI0016617DD0|nr:site-specific integrase [Azospirillum tabaci]